MSMQVTDGEISDADECGQTYTWPDLRAFREHVSRLRRSPVFASLIAQRELEQRCAGEGYTAALAGEGAGTCPYGVELRVEQAAWFEGYARGLDS